jgi:hypothetical protein
MPHLTACQELLRPPLKLGQKAHPDYLIRGFLPTGSLYDIGRSLPLCGGIGTWRDEYGRSEQGCQAASASRQWQKSGRLEWFLVPASQKY